MIGAILSNPVRVCFCKRQEASRWNVWTGVTAWGLAEGDPDGPESLTSSRRVVWDLSGTDNRLAIWLQPRCDRRPVA